MASSRSNPLPQRESRGTKAEVVYKNRSIHWMIKTVGYSATTFLGLVYFCTVIGDWGDIGITNSEIILIFKVLGVVAFTLAIGCWRLADSLMGGD
jgi:hypothetical protein